jgi:lactate dehydrogenase-like 2-hydroxyacid dehydrogenase
MKFYLIVPDKECGLTSEQQKQLAMYGEVVIIQHKGKLALLTELTQDNDEKILALDPTVFDWDLDVAALDHIPNVKAVITQSTSFDWIHPKELASRNIIGCNCPGFSSESVAEYAICMAIEVARRLPVYIKNNWKIDWSVKPMLLKGKTLGVIGMGRIGKAMAAAGKGIGMDVIYWSRKTRHNDYTFTELAELFQKADVLMPALVENDDTKRIISNDLIDTMKPSAVIVGIGRVKALLPEAYILEKVAQNKLGGYALEGEGAKPLHEYQGNVWALPPMAWISQESLTNLIAMWVDNMVAIADNKPKNIVT